MHGLTNLECTFTVLLFALKSKRGFKYSRSIILLVPSRFCCPTILNSWLILRKPVNIGVHISVWYNKHYRFHRILATGVQWIINLLCFSRGNLFSYNSNCSKTGTIYQSICLTPHKIRTFLSTPLWDIKYRKTIIGCRSVTKVWGESLLPTNLFVRRKSLGFIVRSQVCILPFMRVLYHF
jgi:hypothetical protein